MPRSTQGVTLIEMLVVIGVLGIVGAFGFSGFAREREVREIYAVQAQVATTIERARSLSRRYSYNYRITINPVSALPNTKSDIRAEAVNSLGVVVAGYPTLVEKISSDIRILGRRLSSGTLSNSSLTLTYNGPFGRIDADNVSIVIGKSTASDELKTEVDMLGVTGQVIRRGVTQNP
jgi:prepilin-type N-terminal cleavage/methylation domain-containing protein